MIRRTRITEIRYHRNDNGELIAEADKEYNLTALCGKGNEPTPRRLARFLKGEPNE